MWDPAKNKKFPNDSYVTVSQIGDLTNQVVQVSWRGFTPSSNLLYAPDGTNYPVMVAECRGTHPTKWSQCFGADNGGVQNSFSAFGPMNTEYATTSANGTGETPIQLLTAQEDPDLACDIGSPCSLVIVPSQGGNAFDAPPDCSDHSQDDGLMATGAFSFSSAYGACSWQERIIVPLYFARTPVDCPVKNPAFSIIGSPMLARAMNSWQSALCASSDPLSVQYDSAQNEPLAVQDFQSGSDDVALTTLPASGTSSHHYTYAPVAISAVSIAYWIDNPVTGAPLTHLKLDPSLVLKLLTQSYDFNDEACAGGSIAKGAACDNAVDNNPSSLFTDPEFTELNPHVHAPSGGYQVPTVLSGESDMTSTVTDWIAANKAAKAFAAGGFDQWGMHINTSYLGMQLPTNAFSSMDPFGPISHRYDPVFPLSQVAAYQVENWYPATNWQPDQYGNYETIPPELAGQRALFAILDEADAAAYQLPVASIENADGKFVAPTDASMAATLAGMSTAGNHITQQVNQKRKVAGTYPLTMVIYAMVPTSGISKKKAASIARFLDFVAGDGQQPGLAAGELPPGYLPLTAAMRTETLRAARKVLAQQGGKKPAVAPARAAPTTKPGSASPDISLSTVSNPLTAGLDKYALPVLLVVGALLALGGMFALTIGRGSAAAIARLRRLGLPSWPLPRRTKP
jgi:hypothetical protein